MNRVIVGWAVILLLFAVAMIASPIPLMGSEQLTPLSEIGVFLIPVVVVVAVAGGVATDPEKLTVGGALGNPEVDAVRASQRGRSSVGAPPRAYQSPKEPVHCRHCYTLVAWDVLYCPRCTTPRPCRICGGPLDLVGNTVHCPRCGRAEVFCRCPASKAAAPFDDSVRRRAVR